MRVRVLEKKKLDKVGQFIYPVHMEWINKLPRFVVIFYLLYAHIYLYRYILGD